MVVSLVPGFATMQRRQVLEWFEPGELEVCPRCFNAHGMTTPLRFSFICFGCGYIRWTGGETTVAEVQGREATEPTPFEASS
jgi:hypothetical protein